MQANHFEMFGLPLKQDLDESELHSRHHALQLQLHPDRHANMGPTARRLAEQFTSACNEAYSVLSDPLARAAYLLSLRGHNPFSESNGHKLPADFFERQIELREQLEEITQGKDEKAAADFAGQLSEEIDAELASLVDMLDNRPDDPLPAVACAQRLRYLQNCHKEAKQLVRD